MRSIIVTEGCQASVDIGVILIVILPLESVFLVLTDGVELFGSFIHLKFIKSFNICN